MFISLMFDNHVEEISSVNLEQLDIENQIINNNKNKNVKKTNKKLTLFVVRFVTTFGTETKRFEKDDYETQANGKQSTGIDDTN